MRGMEMSSDTKLLEGIQGAFLATNMDRTGRIKCALCGERKVGKSVLVAKTARKPLFHCDFDDRKESIEGFEGTIIKQYLDVNPNMPTAWNDLESDVATLEYLKKQGKLELKSYCLDSMTYLRQIAENQMMKETNMFRKYHIGTTDYRIAQGWDSVVNIQKMLDTLLSRLFSLDIDIYVIFHTRAEKDKAKSTSEKPVYTDRLTVDPQNLEILLSRFNETWRAFVDYDGKFKVQVRQNFMFNAATTLKLDEVENADIQEMLVKHEQTTKR
jgi:AAA domain